MFSILIPCYNYDVFNLVKTLHTAKPQPVNSDEYKIRNNELNQEETIHNA